MDRKGKGFEYLDWDSDEGRRFLTRVRDGGAMGHVFVDIDRSIRDFFLEKAKEGVDPARELKGGARLKEPIKSEKER